MLQNRWSFLSSLLHMRLFRSGSGQCIDVTQFRSRRSDLPNGSSDRLFRGLRLRSGSALPAAQAPENSLILIVGRSHLDCRAAIAAPSAARRLAQRLHHAQRGRLALHGDSGLPSHAAPAQALVFQGAAVPNPRQTHQKIFRADQTAEVGLGRRGSIESGMSTHSQNQGWKE